METEKLIILLFSIDNSLEHKTKKTSTIKGLILNAREFSGRNLTSGENEMNNLTEYNFEKNLFISKEMNGLMLYLILLEQIGSIFQSKHIQNNSKGILKALEIIPNNINKTYYSSIAGLRHSLVHRFSLCTENKGLGKSFKYQLNWSSNKDIIIPAKIDWCGDFNIKNCDDNQTNIFVYSLIDEIEMILTNCIKELKTGSLQIEPSSEEIIARYTIC